MLAGVLGVIAVTGATAATFADSRDDAVEIVVYKDPNCGCCAKWVEHMRKNGFEVRVEDTGSMAAVKQRFGIGMGLASCHTSVIGDYVFEGHVPATAIARFLEERPDANGLAVPGMPVGSPGMEMGDRVDPYDVVTFDATGSTGVYESHD
jgi:hypothetical protein